jgi:hypothetical protein
MARMRVLTAGTTAIIASALAVAAAFGGGPARAGSHAPGHRAGAASTRAGVTFQPLKLENGWQPGAGGSPRVGFSNGVVYLAGSIRLTGTGGDPDFAVLPGDYAPGIELYLPVFTSGSTEDILVIHSNGRMDVLVNGQSTVYTSLAGISFPLTLKSGKLTLINGWQAAGAAYGLPSVSLSNGVVYLSGAMSQPSGTGSAFATLPKADRPARMLYLPIITTDNSTWLNSTVKATPAGQLSVSGNAAKTFSSLDGVSFPVTLKSSKLTLLNGWKPAPGTAAPSVSLSNGVVYLSGAVSAGTQVLVATLPAADRPAHSLFMPVSMAGGTEGSLAIDTQGHVYVTGNDATAMTSLEGIHYPLGS